MTTPPTAGHNDGWEMDQLHRDEITVAMNWVIRTCQQIVRERSHKTFWAPAGTTDSTPTPEQLMQTAREDVLDKLLRIINGAQCVMKDIEHQRAKRKT
ncbi:hypothetical protein [Streptomyces sparsogenes]|uniref:Uncharacterized protein n=1 Tax=Streptomyces sparsogenes DSM 40356 TaxID=1331668 RepID=A0A1R1SLK9_9ACTN|nr:hypothetical protein [Streptomyces sparsogenes]OMI39107.1 hypothetical protein SPAR_12838 [Streptomyces sparsogenes DSM 40356]